MRNFMKNYVNQERNGFAISYEICMCLMLFAVVVPMTIYFAELFETERYFANVTSATCQMASRFGGNNSKAYQIQVGKDAGTISQNANTQLLYIQNRQAAASKTKTSSGDVDYSGAMLVPQNGNEYITVSDPDSDGNIEVKLSYRLGSHGWGTVGQWATGNNAQVTQTFKLPTLMQSGKLMS